MSKVVKGVTKAVSKVVSGVAKGVKAVAKSKIGKIALTAAAIYFGGAAISGALGTGTTVTGALGNALSSLGTAGQALLAGDFSAAGSALASGFSGAATDGVINSAVSSFGGSGIPTVAEIGTSVAAEAPSTGLVGSNIPSVGQIANSTLPGAPALSQAGTLPTAAASPWYTPPTPSSMGPGPAAGGPGAGIIQSVLGKVGDRTGAAALTLGGQALAGAAQAKGQQQQEQNLLRRAYQNYSVGNLRV